VSEILRHRYLSRPTDSQIGVYEADAQLARRVCLGHYDGCSQVLSTEVDVCKVDLTNRVLPVYPMSFGLRNSFGDIDLAGCS
jgi:hypothetical protein